MFLVKRFGLKYAYDLRNIAVYCNSRLCSNIAEENVVGVKKRREPFVTIPLETSIKYMNSKAYQQTYEGKPVWEKYRRNHKGQLPPRKTRRTCVQNGLIATGNPCPICRDEYLILHEKNPSLLKQFISEHTGQIISYRQTNLCQRKHRELVVAINRARDQGTITFDVPFREYDYSDYLPKDPSN